MHQLLGWPNSDNNFRLDFKFLMPWSTNFDTQIKKENNLARTGANFWSSFGPVQWWATPFTHLPNTNGRDFLITSSWVDNGPDLEFKIFGLMTRHTKIKLINIYIGVKAASVDWYSAFSDGPADLLSSWEFSTHWLCSSLDFDPHMSPMLKTKKNAKTMFNFC